MEDEELFNQAALMCAAITVPMTLRTAIELKLFDIISNNSRNIENKDDEDGMISASEIAFHIQSSDPNVAKRLDRLLSLLTCYSLLRCAVRTRADGSKQKVYGLTSSGRYFADDENGETLRMFPLLQNCKETVEPWYYLKDSILEGGIPWERAYGGTPLFKFMDANPKFTTIFNGAMDGLSTIVTKKLIEKYKGFEGLKSLVDVGGGTGRELNIILSKYPRLKAINFDLPHVIQQSPHFPGIEHVAGDMFVSIPKAEAVLLKGVLHNWDNEHCVDILKKAKEALSRNGKVIIVDNVLQLEIKPCDESRFLLQVDNVMAAYNRGQERTIDDFMTLSERAGFTKFQALASVCGSSVMELHA